MKRVVVLGGSGMLGAMLVDRLAMETDIELAATVRTAELRGDCAERIPEVEWRLFDAVGPVDRAIDGAEWIVNAIGIIKPYVHDDRASEVERAIRVNALFPHELAAAARKTGARVIQIATDCVYSGATGGYTETSSHDALDAYGKTKSLGEVAADHVHHLRCSIVGPEPRGHLSLLDWFLGQAQGVELSGYTNHQWNGVTTLHFAAIVAGIIREAPALPPLQHLVPADAVAKFNLLGMFAESFRRYDLRIKPTVAPIPIDRTLRTIRPEINGRLWAAAGYDEPPTVAGMVEELSRWQFRLAGLRPSRQPQ